MLLAGNRIAKNGRFGGSQRDLGCNVDADVRVKWVFPFGTIEPTCTIKAMNKLNIKISLLLLFLNSSVWHFFDLKLNWIPSVKNKPGCRHDKELYSSVLDSPGC